jgi:hypothetical protein
VQAIRYLGSTLGVALVVAFTTGVAAPDLLGGFHHVWTVLVVCGVTVSVLSTQLVRVTAPAPAGVALVIAAAAD